eukprot:6209833-Pleurochrysis_carterae.AAC.1
MGITCADVGGIYSDVIQAYAPDAAPCEIVVQVASPPPTPNPNTGNLGEEDNTDDDDNGGISTGAVVGMLFSALFAGALIATIVIFVGIKATRKEPAVKGEKVTATRSVELENVPKDLEDPKRGRIAVVSSPRH